MLTSLERMSVRVLLVALVVFGCDNNHGDALGDAANGSGAGDATVGSGADVDPVGLPCTGRLGFPNVPGVQNVDSLHSFAMGDLNGDGHKDLVLGSGSLKTVMSNGDGTYQPAVALGVGSNIRPVAIGDLNGMRRPISHMEASQTSRFGSW